MSASEAKPPGQDLAVLAESLFLANLLILPGLAFLLLVGLYFRHRDAPALARLHLGQAVGASLWAGGLLVVANGLIIFLGGYDSPHAWLIVILYFTTCHAALVLLGILALAKALSGKPYRYPLIGRFSPA